MSKKLLKSLFIVFSVVFITVGTSGAYFSDSKIITGNIFSTGYWNKLVINEVYYDYYEDSSDHENDREWVELYNWTDSDVNIKNWTIQDNHFTKTLVTDQNRIIKSGETLILVADRPDGNMLASVPADKILLLGRKIGNGLNQAHDYLILRDNNENIIDVMIYGNKVPSDPPIFSDARYWTGPACLDVARGHSLSRWRALDSNTNVDFLDEAVPSPGERGY